MADTGRRPWGLALCGGGACGYANIGVVEALYESGLQPDCIAGSSMGAVIAGMSALGHLPSTIVFSPVEIGGEQFIDLVHFGAVPARSLRQAHGPEVVVASDTQPRFDQIEAWLPRPIRKFLAAGRQESDQDLRASDLTIRPALPGSMLRFDLATEFAAAGRDAAATRLAELQTLLN